MEWLFHMHLFAAISWIGGSVFMFVLGVTLTDKQKQKEVYPHIGPIFGYFELASLVVLLITGVLLIMSNGLISFIFTSDSSELNLYLRTKLFIVFLVIIATVVHFTIALKTNTKKRSKMQNILSRSSSIFIFFANLFILHYAIMIRSIL